MALYFRRLSWVVKVWSNVRGWWVIISEGLFTSQIGCDKSFKWIFNFFLNWFLFSRGREGGLDERKPHLWGSVLSPLTHRILGTAWVACRVAIEGWGLPALRQGGLWAWCLRGVRMCRSDRVTHAHQQWACLMLTYRCGPQPAFQQDRTSGNWCAHSGIRSTELIKAFPLLSRRHCNPRQGNSQMQTAKPQSEPSVCLLTTIQSSLGFSLWGINLISGWTSVFLENLSLVLFSHTRDSVKILWLIRVKGGQEISLKCMLWSQQNWVSILVLVFPGCVNLSKLLLSQALVFLSMEWG